MPKKPVSKVRDDRIETFAAVFHSYRDLHRVTPLQFLKRLERRGVVLSGKRRPVSNGDGEIAP